MGGTGINSVAAEDLGMFLPRTGGTQRIKLERWSQDLERQVESSAYLYGMAVPLRNARIVVENDAFQAGMIQAGRKEELNKMLLILQRTQGAPTNASLVDQFGSYLQKGAAVAGLGFRVSSGGTAAMSFPAILSEVPISALVRPVRPLTQDYLRKMWTDSALLDMRARERRINAEVGIAASKDAFSLLFLGKSSKIADKGFFFVQEGDNTAIGMIHKIAVNEITGTPRNGKNVKWSEWDGRNPADLEPMNSEFEGGYPTDKGVRWAAARRAEYLTRRTQPMYDMLDRSAILSDPSTVVKTYSLFRTALNAQWNVLVRGLNKYANSGRTASDKAILFKTFTALGIAGTAVAVWKNKWRWAKDTAYRETKESVGIFSFDEDRDMRTVEEEIRTLVRDAAKNIGQLSTMGKYMILAGEIAADRIFGDGFNWNREVVQNPALELMGDSLDALVFKWPQAIKDAQLADEFVKGTPDNPLTPDDMKFNQQILDKMVQSWGAALRSTLNVGVRLAHIPAVAPYQEWIKPALRGTKIKIIREVTFSDMDDPRPFAEDVARLYELRSLLTKRSKEKRLKRSEENALSMLNSFVPLMDKTADKLKNLSDADERRMEFQMLHLEIKARQQELQRLLK
jgi:hypothetical protein